MLARRLRLLLLFALAPAAALAEGPATPVDVMPLREVRPGMQGVGRTVFEGARIDSFGVRILGVLDNAIGPRRSLVLARLEGGPLAETGVIAGMSGSPVFIGGRLLGAVSYAFPFGKQPIAGITPFADMLDAMANPDAPRAASTRLPLRGTSLAAPLDAEAVAAMLGRPLPALLPTAFRGEPLPSRLAGPTCSRSRCRSCSRASTPRRSPGPAACSARSASRP